MRAITGSSSNADGKGSAAGEDLKGGSDLMAQGAEKKFQIDGLGEVKEQPSLW